MSYAIISYRTAYMKCHHTREYMAALLTSVLDNSTKVAEYITECREYGITLLPPDINESDADFAVVGDNIRFGLAAVKNVGRGFVRSLMEDRRLNGKFTAFDEFCRRMYGKELNRRAVESLIRRGPLTVSATNAGTSSGCGQVIEEWRRRGTRISRVSLICSDWTAVLKSLPVPLFCRMCRSFLLRN